MIGQFFSSLPNYLQRLSFSSYDEFLLLSLIILLRIIDSNTTLEMAWAETATTQAKGNGQAE
jgi:hypothetical protein